MSAAHNVQSVKSAFQLIGAAIATLRREYHDGCRDRNFLQRVSAQHQLTWLVPLHRALRAYLNNHCPGSQGRYSQGYYSYREKYDKVVRYFTERVSIEGTGRLQRELHPLVQALAIPVPATDKRALSVGMSVSAFINELNQRLDADRRAYYEASNRFLDSLDSAQLSDLRAMMSSSHNGTVTLRLKDLKYR